MVFKAPNFLGNINLKYYTMIFLYYTYLYEDENELVKTSSFLFIFISSIFFIRYIKKYSY